MTRWQWQLDIQHGVLKELNTSHVQPNKIGVSVKDGVVTLSGQVDSYLKKWEAEQAALRVVGVKAVANDIEVKLPSGRTDANIAAAERAVQAAPGVLSVDNRITISLDAGA